MKKLSMICLLSAVCAISFAQGISDTYGLINVQAAKKRGFTDSVSLRSAALRDYNSLWLSGVIDTHKAQFYGITNHASFIYYLDGGFDIDIPVADPGYASDLRKIREEADAVIGEKRASILLAMQVASNPPKGYRMDICRDYVREELTTMIKKEYVQHCSPSIRRTLYGFVVRVKGFLYPKD